MAIQLSRKRKACDNFLKKLAPVFPFSELTTDASSSIMKLVREMKGILRM